MQQLFDVIWKRNYNENIQFLEGEMMDFKSVPNKYRPILFWSWDEKLDVNKTKCQIKFMNDVGIEDRYCFAEITLKN